MIVWRPGVHLKVFDDRGVRCVVPYSLSSPLPIRLMPRRTWLDGRLDGLEERQAQRAERRVERKLAKEGV